MISFTNAIEAHRQYTWQAHRDLQGDAESAWDDEVNGRQNGFYFSYNAETGYKIVSLNIFQRFLRAAFGFYSDTHLKNVGVKLLTDNDCESYFKRKIINVWTKTYPNDLLPDVNLRTMTNFRFKQLLIEATSIAVQAIRHTEGDLFNTPVNKQIISDTICRIEAGETGKGITTTMWRDGKEEIHREFEEAVKYVAVMKELVPEYFYRAGITPRPQRDDADQSFCDQEIDDLEMRNSLREFSSEAREYYANHRFTKTDSDYYYSSFEMWKELRIHGVTYHI